MNLSPLARVHHTQPLLWQQHSKGFFQHQLRESLRTHNYKAASKGQDFYGIQNACVDRHTLAKSMSKMSAYQKGTFGYIMWGLSIREAVL